MTRPDFSRPERRPGDQVLKGHYTQILIRQEGELFCPWPISKHGGRLCPDLPFLRTHRSFLVNFDHVEGFRRDGDKGYCLIREAEDVPEYSGEPLADPSRAKRARPRITETVLP